MVQLLYDQVGGINNCELLDFLNLNVNKLLNDKAECSMDFFFGGSIYVMALINFSRNRRRKMNFWFLIRVESSHQIYPSQSHSHSQLSFTYINQLNPTHRLWRLRALLPAITLLILFDSPTVSAPVRERVASSNLSSCTALVGSARSSFSVLSLAKI